MPGTLLVAEQVEPPRPALTDHVDGEPGGLEPVSRVQGVAGLVGPRLHPDLRAARQQPVRVQVHVRVLGPEAVETPPHDHPRARGDHFA